MLIAILLIGTIIAGTVPIFEERHLASVLIVSVSNRVLCAGVVAGVLQFERVQESGLRSGGSVGMVVGVVVIEMGFLDVGMNVGLEHWIYYYNL